MALYLDTTNSQSLNPENMQRIEVGHFPDHTQAIKPILTTVGIVTLVWHYENDEELATLLFATKHLQNMGLSVNLNMPYVPNARMDRTQEAGEVFTLKYFAEFINSLNFLSVSIFDPHSTVSEALFDRLLVQSPERYIKHAISTSKAEVVFMPDEGAHKRYSRVINGLPTTFGIKRRDWKTGDILSYDVVDGDMVKDKDVLIVDDISSKGGTFFFAAKALKKAGAKSVSLYVSHVEETITKGELLKDSSPLEHIYTADPLFDISKISKISLVY